MHFVLVVSRYLREFYNTGFSISYNEEQAIFAASTIKAPKDIYIYEMASQGKINLNDIDLGVMQLYTDGVPVPISSEHDRKITAIHEAGHAVMNLLLDRTVIKVSVVPYSSGIGGLTQTTREETENDKLRLEQDYINDIKVLLAGKVAEDLILGQHTHGASNDLEKATSTIYTMTTSFGFNNNLFNINVLLREGAMSGVNTEMIDKCNKELLEIEKGTIELLEDNLYYVRELADRLMKEDTVLYPTLKSLDIAIEDKKEN